MCVINYYLTLKFKAWLWSPHQISNACIYLLLHPPVICDQIGVLICFYCQNYFIRYPWYHSSANSGLQKSSIYRMHYHSSIYPSPNCSCNPDYLTRLFPVKQSWLLIISYILLASIPSVILLLQYWCDHIWKWSSVMSSLSQFFIIETKLYRNPFSNHSYILDWSFFLSSSSMHVALVLLIGTEKFLHIRAPPSEASGYTPTLLSIPISIL